MGEAYPGAGASTASEIERVLAAEEERFGETLARGLKLFEEAAARRRDLAARTRSRLHDTYGFPLELTRELARERGLPVDEDGFRALMAEHREVSRGAARGRSSARPSSPERRRQTSSSATRRPRC